MSFWTEENGIPVDCSCSNPSSSCMIVPIPADDPYLDRECIGRKGSMRATTCDHLTNTSLPAEQLNRLSAYIDAETIYGWNEGLLNELRDTSSGTYTRLIIFFFWLWMLQRRHCCHRTAKVGLSALREPFLKDGDIGKLHGDAIIWLIGYIPRLNTRMENCTKVRSFLKCTKKVKKVQP